MKNFDENELIDKAMAGRLSEEEQGLWDALLAERPELQAELEIGQALKAMPKPPQVSTNFTALVLQEVNTAHPEPPQAAWLHWLRWPRLATIAGVVAVAVTLIHREVEQRQVAQSVKSFTGGISAVAAKPDARPEVVMTVLQDFEAIRRLPGDETYVDDSLLAVLSE